MPIGSEADTKFLTVTYGASTAAAVPAPLEQ